MTCHFREKLRNVLPTCHSRAEEPRHSAQIHRFEKVVEALKGELSSLLQRGLVPSEEDAHELFSSAVQKLEGGYSEGITSHARSLLRVATPSSLLGR
jgi:hypothetical protein